MKRKEVHPSRELEFTDDLKSFHIWWEAFFSSLEEDDHWIKEYNFDNFKIMLNQFLPKRTKILSRAFLKDIIEVEDHRLLILLSHLYFENFIDEIIRNRLEGSSKIFDFTFSIKLEILHASKILDEWYYNEFKFINNLRNKFAHNLSFDILDINFEKSPTLKRVKAMKKYRSKSAKIKLYDFTLRLYLILLIFVFSEEFKELYLLDVKKKPNDYFCS